METSMKNLTKSGVSPAQHGSEVHKDVSNATRDLSDEETHAACKPYCDDEGLVCYSAHHGSRFASDDWKEEFIVKKRRIEPKEHPALAKASIGYPMGKKDRWGQKIFISEEDGEKLWSYVCDVDFAEDLHGVDDVSYDVQIQRDHFLGSKGVKLRAIAGLEDVCFKGTYPRRAADATAAFRAFATRNDGWE